MANQRDFVGIAEAYAREAVADRKGRKFCKWVRLAAQRHLSDLKRARKKGCPINFSAWHATDVCGFIEKLPHVEGNWATPEIKLEPAQIFILVCVFGWRRKADGLRRFTTAYIELARKNAKSTLAAGIALYCLTCEGENGPQIIIGATTGEQAQKVFKPAKMIVERTQDLREAFQLEALAKSIPCWSNGGFIQTINAKSSTQDGWNPQVGILDELHAHKDRGLYDVIRSAFGARRAPLLWIITTAGYDVTGVCYEQRTLLTKILEGIVEADHYFGIIYTLDEGDNPYDERVWGKANPLLGVSVQLDDLRKYAIEAKNSPDSAGEYQTKRMNIWTNARKAFVNMAAWKKCSGAIDIEELTNVPCYGGLDLAAVSDMNAFRLTWKVGDRVKTWGKFYLPEETVRPRTEKGNVPYQTWAAKGLITLTPGEVTDYAFIEKDIRWALGKFKIIGIGFDPWQARDMANRLMEGGAPMVEFRQGIPSFASAMTEMERIVKGKTLDHGDDPILAWNASNMVARKDVNNNAAPDKSKSHEKIDGIVAFLMALGLQLAAQQPESGSYTASHGVLVL
jgi:phage terminase large subunit-like protein